MTSSPTEGEHFVFRKNDNIGAAAAEEDNEFLADCFVDVGDVSCLLDCENSKRVVVGELAQGRARFSRWCLLGESM